MANLTRRGLFGSTAAGVAFAATPLGAADAQERARMDYGPRERLLMDFDWRFALGHANDMARDFGFGLDQRTFAKQGANVAAAAALDFDDAGWRTLQLPHDWGVELPFAPSRVEPPAGEDDQRAAHGFKPLGRDYPETSVGWYRKRFNVPESDLGRRISIEFDGVFRDCLVMINGYAVYHNESGYAPFRVDITDFLNYGAENVLAVRVDATLGEGWFYEGAGIYRHVWLVKTAPLHVPQWGLFARAVPRNGGADLLIDAEAMNESDEAQACEIRCVARDVDGRVVAEARAEASVDAWDKTVVQQRAHIAGARLWTLEAPYLYELRAEIWRNGALVDAYSTTFGVRTIRFDAQEGFFLNEQPLKLLGTCNHQDHAGVGAAMPDALQDFRIRKLKEMGSNAYRAAHNPPTSELLDACDRLGMLVIDETRMMTSAPEGMDQLERLIRRDRNHPSVILWSIGNEEQNHQTTERGARIARSMKRLVDELDETRLTTIAIDNDNIEGASPVVDVRGFNYRTHLMAGYHERMPHQSIYGSETGSTVCTRGEYFRDDARHILPAYDREHPWWATTAEFWWKIIADQPFNAGGFIWTGFDYRGEPTPFNRYPSISSYFGVMDTCGFPKDNYFYYKAWWSAEPVLHLLPHWNWAGREGQEIEVWCHSNLDRVELFLNGAPLGSREVPRNGHAEWRVRYAPGVLEARGYRGDQLVLTQTRETAGAAARLHLSVDRARVRGDGEDCVLVTAEVRDALGRFMPTADNLVRFQVHGPGDIIGVGNGNPTSLEADQANERRAFNGLCQAIVRVQRRGVGRMRISATADGLAPASIGVAVRATQQRPSI
jgi:beta-galactosidase